MLMPPPDQAIIGKRAAIAAALKRIIAAPDGVVVPEEERRVYETDALTAYRQLPLLVVLPSTTTEVSAVLRYCEAEGVKVVPRGAGTSLSGGASPISASPTPCKAPASITRPIRRARSPAPSAATSPRIQAACIASNTA